MTSVRSPYPPSHLICPVTLEVKEVQRAFAFNMNVNRTSYLIRRRLGSCICFRTQKRVTILTEVRRAQSTWFHHRDNNIRPKQPTVRIPQSFGLATKSTMSRRTPIAPQAVDAPLTQTATFLVLSVTDTPDAISKIRDTLSNI